MGTYTSEIVPKRRFSLINFVKNDPKFENKSLFDAKCYGARHEKLFRSQNSDIWGLRPKNWFRVIWAQSLWQRI